MLFYPLLHDYPIFLTIEDMPHLIRKRKTPSKKGDVKKVPFQLFKELTIILFRKRKSKRAFDLLQVESPLFMVKYFYDEISNHTLF